MPQIFETPGEAAEAFSRWISRTGYADGTMESYRAKTAAFLEFVTAGGAEYAEALSDEFVRDYAVRDFRKKLMTETKAAPATVETYLSAIGVFYDWLGLGKPRVKRSPARKSAPKSLDEDSLRKAMRGFERRGPRDFAIASVLFQTGIRVGACAALDTDDIWVGDRSGRLDVRHGKGGEASQHPIPADARAALRTWLAVRREQGHPEVGPLWISRFGTRLSVRRIQSMVNSVAAEVGVDLTPHVLRHTFARFYLENGGDVGGLQDALDHRNLSSTSVYTRVGRAGQEEAAERVRIDL